MQDPEEPKKPKTGGRTGGPLDKKDLLREGKAQKKAGRGIQSFFAPATPAAPVSLTQPDPAPPEADNAAAGPAPAESAPPPEPAEPTPADPGKLPPTE